MTRRDRMLERERFDVQHELLISVDFSDIEMNHNNLIERIVN